MFTGIIQAVGEIKRIEQHGGDVRLSIAAGNLDLGDVALGDSIAVNGVCLTAVELSGDTFQVDVSGETLRCTHGLDAPGEVNLEKAMRLSDRLGGHLVSGHVDGVGEVLRFEPVGECHLLEIKVPQDLARYIATKGSVTVNGVSLTVNQVRAEVFAVNLIPHTVQATTLKHLRPGARVNIEVDMLARYVERLAGFAQQVSVHR
jgi:riboflavin synthase